MQSLHQIWIRRHVYVVSFYISMQGCFSSNLDTHEGLLVFTHIASRWFQPHSTVISLIAIHIVVLGQLQVVDLDSPIRLVLAHYYWTIERVSESETGRGSWNFGKWNCGWWRLTCSAVFIAHHMVDLDSSTSPSDYWVPRLGWHRQGPSPIVDSSWLRVSLAYGRILRPFYLINFFIINF